MRIPKLLLLQPLLLLALAASGQAITIYDNPFIIPADQGTLNGNYAIATYATGWQVYTQADALGPHTSASRVFLSKRPFLNAPADTYGIVGMDGTGGTGPKFTFTTDLNIDSTLEDLTFSWLQGDAGPDIALRFAVQVGGQWYASSTGFTTPGQSATEFASVTSTTAVSQALVFSPAAANWNTIDFTPGSVLGMGGLASGDLSGDITGVGFFAETTGGGTSIIRFADFNITAVPEPSTYALVALGLVAAGAFHIFGRRKA